MENNKYMGAKIFLHHNIIELEKGIRGCLPLYCYLALWNSRNNFCHVHAKDVLEFMGVSYQTNTSAAVKNLNMLLRWLKRFGYIDYTGEIETIKDSLIVECKPEYFVIQKSARGKTARFVGITLDAYYKMRNYKTKGEGDNTNRRKISFPVLLHTYVALKKHMWSKHSSVNKAEWKKDPLVACTTFAVLATDIGKQQTTCSVACQTLKDLGLIYYSKPIKVRENIKQRTPVTYSTIFVEVKPESELQYEWQIEYLYGHYKYIESLEGHFISQGKNMKIVTNCPEEIMEYWNWKKRQIINTVERRKLLTIEVDDFDDEYDTPPELPIDSYIHYEDLPF